MGLFDFFKKKNDFKELRKEPSNTNNKETGIKVGQTLYAKNGEKVKVSFINETTIIVEYKYKNHVRDKSVIGKSLFISNPQETKVSVQNMEMEDDNIKKTFKDKDEEHKYQERIKNLQRQREYNHQRELEMQKRQAERKRQEQLIVQARMDKERRIQEKIEIEAKQESERKILEQKRIDKIREFELSGGFKSNLTLLYHDIYGEGLFIEFDSKKDYIIVKFNNKQELTTFAYPDAIGKRLFLEKTNKLVEREKFLNKPENKREDLEEQKYFAKVTTVTDEFLKIAEEKHRLTKYGYNDSSDSFDPTIHYQNQAAYTDLSLWREIRRNPYFGRVDYGENSSFYIGKSRIENLVVDWRDKVCNIYYRYNIYIGNDEYNLSLVRDFKIIAGNYCGFIDKYSNKVEYSPEDSENYIISDEFLIKVIKSNRSDKKTHDIIQTIQRNQYEIITYDEFKSIIVLGCAGSGKTMIMLHRLSHIIFNNKLLDIRSIYIISPTRLLNIENDELSKKLEINLANRLSLGLFNVRLIKQYYKKNSLYDHVNFEKITSNSSIDDNLIKKIYSESFINTFKQSIISLILSDGVKRKEFTDLEERSLLEEYSVFCETDVKIRKISGDNIKCTQLYEVYEEIKKAVSKVPFQNAIDKINRISVLLDSSKIKDKTLRGKKELLENLTKDWDMSDKTIYIGKNGEEVSVSDEIFNEVFGYFNLLGKDNSQNRNILGDFMYLEGCYSDVFELFNSYKQLIEKINRFRNFVIKNNLDYFSEIMSQQIFYIKRGHQIDQKNIYEFEVFLHLVACNAIFNTLHGDRIFIFIDEFQDYAITELTLYRRIFPNAIFNLFGDTKQAINPKGLIKNEESIITDIDWQKFSINENYRNAHQITEYINSEFSIDMTPIGMEGFVYKLDITHLRSKIKLDGTDRFAFIVKDISFYEDINAEYSFDKINKVNIIIDDECEVKKGYLNIIPIRLAKGLEFEQVYVVPSQMTQNERYVAYTRALNKLYVLN